MHAQSVNQGQIPCVVMNAICNIQIIYNNVISGSDEEAVISAEQKTEQNRKTKQLDKEKRR